MMKLETLELVREQVENKKIFGLEDCKNLDFKFSIGCETIVAINTNGDRITITSDKQYEHLQRYKSEVKLYDKEVTSCSYILIDEKYNRLIDTKIFYMLGDVIKAYDGVLNLGYVRLLCD